ADKRERAIEAQAVVCRRRRDEVGSGDGDGRAGQGDGGREAADRWRVARREDGEGNRAGARTPGRGEGDRLEISAHGLRSVRSVRWQPDGSLSRLRLDPEVRLPLRLSPPAWPNGVRERSRSTDGGDGPLCARFNRARSAPA